MIKSLEQNGTQRGFTLIEVLISMVVFSLLMILVSNSMSFATRFWQKEHGHLNSKIDEFIYIEKLSRAVAAAQPYAIFVGRSDNLSLFFSGTEQNIMFVSDTGLQERGPVVINLRVIEDIEFGQRIQIAEQPLAKTMLIKDQDLNEIEWQWKTLKSNVANARFSFYGYKNLDELILDVTTSRTQKTQIGWHESFQGQQRGLLPKKILMQWQSFDFDQVNDISMEFPIMVDDKGRYSFIEVSKSVGG